MLHLLSMEISSLQAQLKARFQQLWRLPRVCFLSLYSNYELRTRDSRGVFAKETFYKEAVAASSIATKLAAALLTGDMVKAGQAIAVTSSRTLPSRTGARICDHGCQEKWCLCNLPLELVRLSWSWLTPDKMPKIKAELESNLSKASFMIYK